MCVDFTEGTVGYRLRGGASSRPSHLLRAVLAHESPRPQIIDAMAGMGHDGFEFAAAGCSVVMIERDETVFALLEDGIQRALARPETSLIAARIRLLRGDALDLLRSWDRSARPGVVYIDPMYPESSGTAAVKKRSQFLRLVAGSDPNGAIGSESDLLVAARGLATRRVVVKRPKSAEALAGVAPSGCVRSKSTRWDVYAPV